MRDDIIALYLECSYYEQCYNLALKVDSCPNNDKSVQFSVLFFSV